MKAALDLSARYFKPRLLQIICQLSPICFRFLCRQSLPSNFSMEQCMKAALDLSARYFILSSAANYILTFTAMFQIPVSSRLALQLQCGTMYESCP